MIDLSREVELTTGKREHAGLVSMVHMALSDAFARDPLMAYDVVMRAREPNYKFFGSAEERAKRLAILDDNGVMHGSVRNIILAAVTGDGLDMQLHSPIKPPELGKPIDRLDSDAGTG